MPGLPRDIVDVITKAVNGHLQDIQISLPGKVVAYDPVANLADVEIQTEHPVYNDDNRVTYEDLGILAEIPVAFPRGGGFVVRLPLAAGDTGQLIFSSASLLEWRMTGAKSQPADGSRHTVTWAVFYPGLAPDTNPPAARDAGAAAGSLIIGVDGGSPQIRISKSDIELGVGATDFVALASLVNARLSTIQATFDGHTHTFGPAAIKVTGSASAQQNASSIVSPAPDQSVGTLASVAATLVKAM